MRKKELHDINLIIALINSTNRANENLYYLQKSLELAEIKSKMEDHNNYQILVIEIKKIIIIVEKSSYKDIYISRMEEK